MQFKTFIYLDGSMAFPFSRMAQQLAHSTFKDVQRLYSAIDSADPLP